MTAPASQSASTITTPKITLLSAAQIASEISSHKWQDINLSDSGSESVSILILVERVLAILLIRLLAILHKRELKQSTPSTDEAVAEAEGGESSTTTGSPTPNLIPDLKFKDYSTSGICQSIIGHPKKESLQWPEAVTEEVIQQMHDYIYTILDMYRSISYHNREHAYHVFMSGHKLLDLVLCEYDWSSVLSTSAIPIRKPHRATFGIKTDPLLQMAFLYSALVHDVDHSGVSNRQLVIESDELAIMYNDQSCAEQRSLAIAFSQLMKKEYAALKKVMFQDDEEYKRFRKTVIDLVLCTDIASPERVQIVKSKWKEAFGDKNKARSSMKMLMEANDHSDDEDEYDDDGTEMEANHDNKSGSTAPKKKSILKSSPSDANLLTVPDARPKRGGRRGSVRRHCLKHNTAVYGNVLIDIDTGIGTSLVGPQNSTKKKSEDAKAKITNSVRNGGGCRDREREREHRRSSPAKSRIRRLFSTKSMPFVIRRKSTKKKKKSARQREHACDSDFAQGDSDVAIEDSDSDTDFRPANGITDISGLTASCAFPLRESVVPAPGKKTMHEFLDEYDEDLSFDSIGSSASSSMKSKKVEEKQNNNCSKVLNRQSKSFGDHLKKTEGKGKSNYQMRLESKIKQTKNQDSDLTYVSRGPDGLASSQENIKVWRRSSTLTLDRRFTDPPESSFNRKKFHIRLGIRRALDLSGNQIPLYEKSGSKKNLRADDMDEPDALKAIVVLEQLLKASDVAANMQSWETAVLWCKRLFKEQMNCYKEGRGVNPLIGWHENQIAFFESYTMPLACRLVETGVFEAEAVRDFVNGVRQNNIRWMIEGQSVVRSMIQEWEAENPDFLAEP